MLTRLSITGTSTKTPTVVAKATGESAPKREIATATASSKKWMLQLKLLVQQYYEVILFVW